MSTSSPVAQHYQNILQDIDALRRLLKEVEPRQAIAASIAPLPKGETVRHHADIEIHPVFGREAVLTAAAAYRDMHIHPDFCQKAARRTPGVLWYAPSQDQRVLEIPALVKRINGSKTAIEHYITRNYPTRTARFEALRADCPGVMAVHLYRHIRCLNDLDATQVRFSWLRKQLLSKPIKASLMEAIEQDMEAATDKKLELLQALLVNIGSTPEHRLRLRRRAPVQPAVNITFDGGSVQTINANMPIILIQQRRPDLKPPVSFSYDKAARKRVRSDKIPALKLGTFSGYAVEVFPE